MNFHSAATVEIFTDPEKGLTPGPIPTPVAEDRKLEWKHVPSGIGGYMHLAEHMGEHPNRAIFRRFGELNALNVLFLQAELVELEAELRQEATLDAKSEIMSDQFRALDWLSLRDSNCKQWKKMRWHF